ncbi:hypothetical protein AN219_14545 [Streptomyces nanshensis]|nr:hypothetical protein AN219_14545 [Streptomyces nanshensis]
MLGWIGTAVCIFGALILVAGVAFGFYVYAGTSEQTDNSQAYGRVLWRNHPADKVFPKTLAATSSYISTDGKASGPPGDPKRGQWQRLGIAPGVNCVAALGSTTAQLAQRVGCKAAPRATYADPSGNVVATVALVVSTDDGADKLGGFLEGLDSPRGDFKPGVHAYRVPGTLAAKWSDRQRNGMGGAQLTSMPYAVAVTTGAADGRLAGRLPAPWSERYDAGTDRQPWSAAAANLATGLSDHLEKSLGDT